MLRATPFAFFGTNFTLYTFDHVGDELPIHDHTFEHGSVVAHGRVEIFGVDKRIEVEAPHVIVFPTGKPHGIRALTDGAAVLNVMPPP
jgi:quercetin dioxygenase-like cupin family protein